ncbi:MAG: sulfotransferase [Fimbriimonas sp.]|nr:sulfotransferase [Fimbriimonas sp.]
MTPIEVARQFFYRGAFHQAVDAISAIPEDQRSQPDIQLLLGVSLARLRRVDDACVALSRVLEADPSSFEAITWMAVLKKNRWEIDEAFRYAQLAIDLQPENPVGYGALGACHLYIREPLQAIEAFATALSRAPASAENHHNIALAYQMLHRHAEAISHLQQAIRLAPRNIQSYLVLSGEFLKYGDAGRALDCLAEGLKHNSSSAALNSAIAAAFTLLRNDQSAEAHHVRAMSISPAEAKAPYAAWLLNQGRFEEAGDLYGSMLHEEATAGLGFYGITQCRKLTDLDEDLVGAMEQFRNKGRMSPMSELHLRYGLGKVNETRGRYGEAIADYDVANRLAYQIHNSGAGVQGSPWRDEQERVRALFERFDNQPGCGHPGQSPIFIIGMIRSGTTLLDQILASHPSVKPAGEIQFWTEETVGLASLSDPVDPQKLRALATEYLSYIELVTGSSERITDKMPLNFAYAGIIHRALPNARFLHIRRNPVDTCLSIYTTYFGYGPQFAYDRSNIVDFYRAYLFAMEYWRNHIPADRLLEIDYEDLIARPGSVIPEVISFCGLPWDSACLHHDKNASAINTPSRWQARQPIYRTSVARWRHYEPWLGQFAELLAECEPVSVQGVSAPVRS